MTMRRAFEWVYLDETAPRRDFERVYLDETARLDLERIYLAEPERRHPALDDLADEYHRRCEEFDRTVCTGPIREGEIMPATDRERMIINRYASTLREELWHRAARMGYSLAEYGEAIRDAYRRHAFR
ncbi:hypothetical protein WK59_21520 [Burkholderia ubonensis]|uniref:hypothetical protein n=1 Tax=Burkholderia ubonensis TaxID=101571 RepID=UPI00075CC880|nr:hypothetical protein [Burkholderia ubonensis]KVT80614.1 hypothetical protein WK59_21520 [Burkholderia ubonensis]